MDSRTEITSRIIAGVDEVGRGCLAGPVVAATVVLPKEQFSWIEEIKDSKKLTAKKREKLSVLICENCCWAVREASVHHIEDCNILKATLWAMKKAVDALCFQIKPDLVLVDGNHPIPGLDLPQETLKNGDNLNKSIAAASIVAKVYRDKLMAALDDSYPGYGLARNKGYGTEEHRLAIMLNGPTEIHRKTFRGVAEYVTST